MTETTKTQTALTSEPSTEQTKEHQTKTIKTELLRAFLQFGMVLTDEQILRFTPDMVSLRSRNTGNTGMCIVEAKIPFGITDEIGINLSQLSAALPKIDEVAITPGRKIRIESTDYRANLITTSLTDPTLIQTKLKKDFSGEGGFIVGTKDFLEKVGAMRTTFAKGEYFLTLVSDESLPEEITLSADDNAVGDVKYRITVGGGKPETWSRSYDYELLQPILKKASEYCQELKVSWLILAKENDSFAVMVLSGTTPDGLISFSYALAPRVIQKTA
jgi:hypothetical protein